MFVLLIIVYFFFFKQKTAYEMRISDWSSDVFSSDLHVAPVVAGTGQCAAHARQRPGQVDRGGTRGVEALQRGFDRHECGVTVSGLDLLRREHRAPRRGNADRRRASYGQGMDGSGHLAAVCAGQVLNLERQPALVQQHPRLPGPPDRAGRSEEHTSEIQSLMRISYAV